MLFRRLFGPYVDDVRWMQSTVQRGFQRRRLLWRKLRLRSLLRAFWTRRNLFGVLLMALVLSKIMQILFFQYATVLTSPPLQIQTRHLFNYASFIYEDSTGFVDAHNHTTVVALFMADNQDIGLPYVQCAHVQKRTVPTTNGTRSSTKKTYTVAQLARVEYVALCRQVMFVAWCHFSKEALAQQQVAGQQVAGSGNGGGGHFALDFGIQVLADQRFRENYTTPILHKIYPKVASKTQRQLVMCISRIFAFEKWDLLITAMEVYRAMGVDLVVMHIYSVLTSIFGLIKFYELEGRLAIRKGIRFPFFRTMNFDPNSQIEYSGQLAMAHECFYEFRASAQFIGLFDLDDLLVSTADAGTGTTPIFPQISVALNAASRKYPNASYFYINKLESGILERNRKALMEGRMPFADFLQSSILSKQTYNSEKMIVRPQLVHGFWIHFTKHHKIGANGVQLSTNNLALLHLSKNLHSTKEYNEGIIGKVINWTAIGDSMNTMYERARSTIREIPKRLYYFNRIRHCSKFMNAYPLLTAPVPCLSYALCKFPKMKDVPCTVSTSVYRSKPIKPANIYYVHIHRRSLFYNRQHGCLI